MLNIRRAGVKRKEPAPFELTLMGPSRFYFPVRGLGCSLIVHVIIFIGLQFVPFHRSTREPLAPWERTQEYDGGDSRFVMYLPPVGGGRSGKKKESAPSDTEAAAAPARAKRGMVYPGPQLVRSDFPDPTNNLQTLLQPELKDPPTLKEPVPLPNLLSIPKAVDARPSRLRDPAFVLPRKAKPEEPPAEPAELAKLQVEDLPTVKPPADLSNLVPKPDIRPVPEPKSDELAVGLAPPDQAARQQPVAPSEGVPREPLQLKITELPSPVRAVDMTSLTPMPEVAPPPESPTRNAPEEQLPPERPEEASAESSPNAVERETEQPPAPTPAVDDGAPQAPAELPSRGTDLPMLLALTPQPAAPGQAVQIPAAEARGNFTIAPEANLETTESEPGLPSSSGLEGLTVGSTAEVGVIQNSPSEVTLTFGPGGSGTGAGSSGTGGTGSVLTLGSGSGPGGGSGTGFGSGSGAGSGSGTGPFAGISIIGGVGGTETAGSSSSSSASEGPLAGITIDGGIGRDKPSTISFPANLAPRPVAEEYGLFVVSTEDSGGGLPYTGVFSHEQINTVYVDVRQSETDDAPLWPLEFAVPEGARQNFAGLEVIGGSNQGFVLPAPTVKERPSFPSGLIRQYLGKMLVVYAVVNIKGKLEQISVKLSPDPLLNQPVIEALSEWVFQPGTLDGKIVPFRVLVGVPLWPSVTE